MRAEKERDTGPVGRFQAAEEVSDRRADSTPRVVLVHLEREVAEIGGHAVRHLPLFARRARQRG